MRRPPHNVPKPPTSSDEAGSEFTEGDGSSFSPPLDLIWTPLPPGILLWRVLYPIGRSLKILLSGLQGRQRWRGLVQDSHWGWFLGGFWSAVGTSSSQPLVTYSPWLKGRRSCQQDPSPGVVRRYTSQRRGGRPPPSQNLRRWDPGFPLPRRRIFPSFPSP